MSDTNFLSIMDLMDRPIAYQRSFVRLGAGVIGAVLLSQAVYWSRRTKHPGGWFYKSQAEWEEETGLKRSEQEKARKALTSSGVLEELRKGVPAKLYFRVNEQKLTSLLLCDSVIMNADEVVSVFQYAIKGLSRGAYLGATKRKIEAVYVDYAQLLKSQGMFCACCGSDIQYGIGKNPDNLAFDYTVSLNEGGTHTEQNLRPVHVKCVRVATDLPTSLSVEERAIKNVGVRQTGVSVSDRQECRSPTVITENTTETTTETTADIITDAEFSAPAAEFLPTVLSKSKQANQDQNTKPPSETTVIWDAYKNAYLSRHQIEPVRNAKVNSQIKQLYQRLGLEAGPVAEFYVLNVNDAYIVKNFHDLGLLLSKAESYRTQWATGQTMTNTRAQQIDSTQTNANAAHEAIAMLRAREGARP